MKFSLHYNTEYNLPFSAVEDLVAATMIEVAVDVVRDAGVVIMKEI